MTDTKIQRVAMMYLGDWQYALTENRYGLHLEFRDVDGNTRFSINASNADLLQCAEFLQREVSTRMIAKERREDDFDSPSKPVDKSAIDRIAGKAT